MSESLPRGKRATNEELAKQVGFSCVKCRRFWIAIISLGLIAFLAVGFIFLGFEVIINELVFFDVLKFLLFSFLSFITGYGTVRCFKEYCDPRKLDRDVYDLFIGSLLAIGMIMSLIAIAYFGQMVIEENHIRNLITTGAGDKVVFDQIMKLSCSTYIWNYDDWFVEDRFSIAYWVEADQDVDYKVFFAKTSPSIIEKWKECR